MPTRMTCTEIKVESKVMPALGLGWLALSVPPVTTRLATVAQTACALLTRGCKSARRSAVLFSQPEFEIGFFLVPCATLHTFPFWVAKSIFFAQISRICVKQEVRMPFHNTRLSMPSPLFGLLFKFLLRRSAPFGDCHHQALAFQIRSVLAALRQC